MLNYVNREKKNTHRKYEENEQAKKYDDNDHKNIKIILVFPQVGCWERTEQKRNKTSLYGGILNGDLGKSI